MKVYRYQLSVDDLKKNIAVQNSKRDAFTLACVADLSSGGRSAWRI